MLDIGLNNIDAQSMSYIADGLRENQGILKLSLHLNKIGSKGAAYLADALKQNQVIYTSPSRCSYLHFVSDANPTKSSLQLHWR